MTLRESNPRYWHTFNSCLLRHNGSLQRNRASPCIPEHHLRWPYIFGHDTPLLNHKRPLKLSSQGGHLTEARLPELSGAEKGLMSNTLPKEAGDTSRGQQAWAGRACSALPKRSHRNQMEPPSSKREGKGKWSQVWPRQTRGNCRSHPRVNAQQRPRTTGGDECRWPHTWEAALSRWLRRLTA
jgi:hypothetical protein